MRIMTCYGLRVGEVVSEMNGFLNGITEWPPLRLTFMSIGVALLLAACGDSTPAPTPTRVPEPESQSAARLKVNYSQQGDPFVVIGPNPGGVFAPTGYSWNMMDIFVESHCEGPIRIDSSRFRLYLSSEPTTEGAQNFAPTTLGIEYQTNRLISGWLEPGDSISGSVIYQVPNKLQDGTESNDAFHIIRYPQQGFCVPEYQPN